MVMASTVTAPTMGYRFAGFWWRFLAVIIDGFILSIVGGIVLIPLALSAAGSGGDEDGARAGIALLNFIINLIGPWLYFALFESSAWQATPGKRVCGLIVTSDTGERISFGRATGRYFAKFLSYLILMIGFMMAGWTRRKQALHDMICDTLVLKRIDPSFRIEVPRAA